MKHGFPWRMMLAFSLGLAAACTTRHGNLTVAVPPGNTGEYEVVQEEVSGGDAGKMSERHPCGQPESA
jgi:hypothetical protein